MRLARWGNSTGVRLPAALLVAAGLRRGDHVSVRLLDSGEIRVQPLDTRKLATANATGCAHDVASVPEEQW